ncbi:MaoC/PaaZ C-terminal domain-containing protein, partial [Aeromonas taiwanensis]
MNAPSLAVGQKASLTKRFGPAEVAAFAGLSEDFNPLHLDPDFAATTVFERPIVHGML